MRRGDLKRHLAGQNQGRESQTPGSPLSRPQHRCQLPVHEPDCGRPLPQPGRHGHGHVGLPQLHHAPGVLRRVCAASAGSSPSGSAAAGSILPAAAALEL